MPGPITDGVLSKEDLARIEGLEKQIEKQQEKIDAYIADPARYDNRGFLSNPRNSDRVQHIINSRIKSLRKQIDNFQKQAQDIKNDSLGKKNEETSDSSGNNKSEDGSRNDEVMDN